MSVWYNEIDPKAAAWLRELIKAKVIPYGEVDERSIEDIRPSELAGYTQCHFFAGIGGWAEALTLAGWPVDRPVWTGSCPCQSFSAAGQGKGFADERHLWPAWFHLIEQCRPPVVFGEQVDAAIRYGWFDLVRSDMEAVGYAIGAAVVPAAGVGAPHVRHRLWFVADSGSERQHGLGLRLQPGQPRLSDLEAGRSGEAGDTAYATEQGWEPRGRDTESSDGCRPARVEPGRLRDAGGLVDSESEQARVSRLARERRKTGGFWAAADWIYCRDDKWRPVEPGTFPLAHGLPARMGRLRGYGNAIVPQVAAEVISAYLAQGDFLS